MKVFPYPVTVNDINGVRLEYVTEKQRKNGETVFLFRSESWAYEQDTKPAPTLEELIELLREGALLMPLGTKKRAEWLRKVPFAHIAT